MRRRSYPLLGHSMCSPQNCTDTKFRHDSAINGRRKQTDFHTEEHVMTMRDDEDVQI